MSEEPGYRGRFVVLEPDAVGYRVSIDPPPPGEDITRTFQALDDAWFYAARLWTTGRLPLRDLTDGNTAREPPSGRREIPTSN